MLDLLECMNFTTHILNIIITRKSDPIVPLNIQMDYLTRDHISILIDFDIFSPAKETENNNL